MTTPADPTSPTMSNRTINESLPVRLTWQNRSSHQTPATQSSSITSQTHPINQLILGRLEDTLSAIPHHSIDFIYLDPPFMTQRNFSIHKNAYHKRKLPLVDDSNTNNQPQSIAKSPTFFFVYLETLKKFVELSFFE